MTAAPWNVGEVPWDRTGTLAKAGLESVWAVGPTSGPLTATGSATNPRDKFVRLQREAGIPLMVHDLQWAQGSKGRAIARAMHKALGSRKVDLAEYRRILDVETTRLNIKLVGHEAFLGALRADAEQKEAAMYREADARFDRRYAHLTKAERETIKAEANAEDENFFSPQTLRDEANARRRERRAAKKRLLVPVPRGTGLRDTDYLR